MVTPLLRKPNEEGGTLYTFASASRDLTRAITNNDYEFKFSHFACLNLPNIYKKYGGYNGNKGICLNMLGYNIDNNDLNKALAEHLQNYVMNFETLILNGGGDDDDYDPDVLRSVSERVFFHWLKAIGGISFDRLGNNYFCEGDSYSGSLYRGADSDSDSDSDSSADAGIYNTKTIPYIGNIDIINSVEVCGDAYNEIYIYIPSGDGATGDIRFQAVSDANYTNMHEYVTYNDNIIGRDTEDVSALGLSTRALYDISSADGKNSYIGDSGFCIDFNDAHYIEPIRDMNAGSGDSFEFNAILIYYDFSYGGKTVTNLYGVLFLDNVKNMGYDERNPIGGIQKYPKIKESSLKNGNSFAFKVDIKIVTMPYTTYKADGGLIEYDELNTIEEFQMFTKVMERVQEVIDIFYNQQNTIMALNNRLAAVESALSNIDTINNISSRISSIEDKISDYGVGDVAVIKSLLEENTDIINSIVGGNLPAEFQYNTDVISSDGYGVEVIKNEDGKSITINSNPNYNVRAVSLGNGSSINSSNLLPVGEYKEYEHSKCYINLGECANLAVVYVDSDICENVLEIYIDDSSCNWKKGQTMRIYFRSESGNYVTIGEKGSVLIHTGDKTTSVNSGDVRCIEMICINDIDLDFVSSVK